MFYEMIQSPVRAFRYHKLAYEFYVKNLLKVGGGIAFKKNIALEKAKKVKRVRNWKFIENDLYNMELMKMIQEDAPFFSCRYGNSELVACFVSELLEKEINSRLTDEQLHKLKSGPGVFPEDENIYLEFAKMYCEALKYADYNAYWGSVIMEEYLMELYLPSNTKLMAMRALEPFQYSMPWTLALKGKKVLVVHPFSELILEQYQKRRKLFNNDLILPDFELKVVRAVQSSGENIPSEYNSWKEALDELYNKCRREDYDIALLSCGSYAVPLGAKMKADGKKAIVLGGMLQLLFGIKGRRWEQSRPDIVALYNDSWIRAEEKYKVVGAEKMVDGAAYW